MNWKLIIESWVFEGGWVETSDEVIANVIQLDGELVNQFPIHYLVVLPMANTHPIASNINVQFSFDCNLAIDQFGW